MNEKSIVVETVLACTQNAVIYVFSYYLISYGEGVQNLL